MNYLFWFLQISLIPTLSPLGIGLINSAKAKFQRRQGPSLLQPYRNLWKLFHKDEVISKDASPIFKVAPYVVFSVTLIVGASIPLLSTFVHPVLGNTLTIIYLLALGTFFLALAGMDAGGAFGGFGSSREMTMAALSEAPFIFSMISLTILTSSTNLFTISGDITNSYGQFFVPIILAFIGFFIVLLAETSRYPFDNADTHLELTMIHEAMLLEYSGKRLALMEWASANKLLIFTSLGANLFFPLGIAHASTIGFLIIALFAWLAKIMIIYLVIATLESSIAKFRFFRLPDLLLAAFIINVVAIGLIA